jgi:hypothetical protein
VKRLAASLLCAAAFPAAAVEGAVMERAWCDPCAPAVRPKSTAAAPAPSQGAALRAQVEGKLRADFEAAAVDGWLTRERASAAGLGSIAQGFEAIDRVGRGAIRFEDYKRYLKARGAALD